MDKRMTESQQEAAFEHFEQSQKKIYNKGKLLFYSTSFISILYCLILLTFDFNLIKLAVELIFLSLLTGITWIRYIVFPVSLFVGYSTLSLFLIATLDNTGTPWYQCLFLFIVTLYFFWSSAVLLTSKSLSEYLFMRKSK